MKKTCGNCKNVFHMNYGVCETGCINKSNYEYDPRLEVVSEHGEVSSLATGEIIDYPTQFEELLAVCDDEELLVIIHELLMLLLK